MIRTLRGLAAGAVLALATTAGGCAGYGWEDVLDGRPGGYGYETDIRGEVRSVGSRHIELRTDGGRSTRVRYDGRTDVRYGDRRYSVRNLDRGDQVVVRVDDRGSGERYARWISVRRSARDRVYDRRADDRRIPGRRGDDAYARTSVEGRVGRVDRGSDRFELRGTSRGTVWVSVPRNASRGMRERIDRLREGQHVRLRGRFLSDNRFEVAGFR